MNTNNLLLRKHKDITVKNSNILLLLSTNRFNEKTIKYALDYALKNSCDLNVLYIEEDSYSTSIFGVLDIGLLDEKIREEFDIYYLRQLEQKIKIKLFDIKKRAVAIGINCEVVIKQGIFVKEGLNLIRDNNISLVISTRSWRSEISRVLFGSPVNKFIKESPCPVIVV